jgi:hypothetical protein
MLCLELTPFSTIHKTKMTVYIGRFVCLCQPEFHGPVAFQTKKLNWFPSRASVRYSQVEISHSRCCHKPEEQQTEQGLETVAPCHALLVFTQQAPRLR